MMATNYGLNIRDFAGMDIVCSARWFTDLIQESFPFRKANRCQIHVSGGEFMWPPTSLIASAFERGLLLR